MVHGLFMHQPKFNHANLSSALLTMHMTTKPAATLPGYFPNLLSVQIGNSKDMSTIVLINVDKP